jgi:2Fe-2S ferredoxin
MPALTVLPSGRTLDVETGTPLLAALQAAGEPIAHKCNGQAKCGGCHLFVQEGRKNLSKLQKLENELLDTLVGVGSKSRLACQTLMGTEPATVELLSFV